MRAINSMDYGREKNTGLETKPYFYYFTSKQFRKLLCYEIAITFSSKCYNFIMQVFGVPTLKNTFSLCTAIHVNDGATIYIDT